MVIFITWIAFILLEQKIENEVKSREKVCKSKDFCEIIMPSEKYKILEFIQYMKLDKMPNIIYADTESLITKNRWMCK